MLGLPPNDRNGPAVGKGIKECTKKAAEYRKEGTSLIYIDLPGVNSTTKTCAINTPQQMTAYAKFYRLQTIDYFILLSQSKFNEQEKILVNYITRVLKKNYIFVQTKMDEVRREHEHKVLEMEKGFDAVKTLIRTQIQSELGCPTTERIFLISNGTHLSESNGQKHWAFDNSSEYEFDLLTKKILEDMSGENGLGACKVDAFILATGAISESVVRATANTLRKQSWGWSTLSGIIGAIPVPGVSLVCDVSMIIGLAADYFKTFGLEPSRYFQGEGATEKLKNLTKLMSASLGARTAAVLATVVGVSLVEEGTKAVPIIGTVIGSVLGATTSFTSTCILLHELINFCEKEALKMMGVSQIASNQNSLN